MAKDDPDHAASSGPATPSAASHAPASDSHQEVAPTPDASHTTPTSTQSPTVPSTQPSETFDLNTLEAQISKAKNLLEKMDTELRSQKEWVQSVHEVIQNYQFKYSKALNDIRLKTKRFDRLRALLDQLKKAQQHNDVKKNLNEAKRNLDQLVGNSPEYTDAQTTIDTISGQLSKLDTNSVGTITSDATNKIDDISSPDVPPSSDDALQGLIKKK